MTGRVIWITGLPGSGKSALADALHDRLPGLNVLRMDDLRKIATPAPTYSETERDVLYRALVYMARRISDLGHDALIDATGNLRRWRELARELIPRFGVIYLTCPPSISRARENTRTDRRGAPPGVYRKGAEGWPVPGAGAPYEEPLHPELVLDTAELPVDKEVQLAIKLLEGL